tara:strand:+ start:7196 stop:7372 length:177 start_codon:yes stop_codon:yes gene_type:complete
LLRGGLWHGDILPQTTTLSLLPLTNPNEQANCSPPYHIICDFFGPLLAGTGTHVEQTE